MTFSPELEKRFADMVTHYPEGRQKAALIPMLMYGQDEVGSVSPELMAEVAKRLKIKVIEVEEVLGYYSMLHRKPMGKYHVQVCTNVACMLVGGTELYDHACKKLGLKHLETQHNGHYSLEEVECIGACSWAPAIQVNYTFHHYVTPEKFDSILGECE